MGGHFGLTMARCRTAVTVRRGLGDVRFDRVPIEQHVTEVRHTPFPVISFADPGENCAE